MPKPVLSDSLFNADNVATAILSEANLQVTNENLGVSDISSEFNLNSSVWNEARKHMIYFNGFIFLSSYLYASGGTPATNTVIYSVSNSDYHPTTQWSLPAHGYQNDNGSSVQVQTNGDLIIKDPGQSGGSSTFYIILTGVYHKDF
jgi:hypothetical protein